MGADDKENRDAKLMASEVEMDVHRIIHEKDLKQKKRDFFAIVETFHRSSETIKLIVFLLVLEGELKNQPHDETNHFISERIKELLKENINKLNLHEAAIINANHAIAVALGFIEQNELAKAEGFLRVSGVEATYNPVVNLMITEPSKVTTASLEELIRDGGVHNLGSAVKGCFRAINFSEKPREMVRTWFDENGKNPQADIKVLISELIKSGYVEEAKMLHNLCYLGNSVAQHENVNKMGVSNIAIVLAPILGDMTAMFALDSPESPREAALQSVRFNSIALQNAIGQIRQPFAKTYPEAAERKAVSLALPQQMTLAAMELYDVEDSIAALESKRGNQLEMTALFRNKSSSGAETIKRALSQFVDAVETAKNRKNKQYAVSNLYETLSSIETANSGFMGNKAILQVVAEIDAKVDLCCQAYNLKKPLLPSELKAQEKQAQRQVVGKSSL